LDKTVALTVTTFAPAAFTMEAIPRIERIRANVNAFTPDHLFD
jgi:hypothetical protein